MAEVNDQRNEVRDRVKKTLDEGGLNLGRLRETYDILGHGGRVRTGAHQDRLTRRQDDREDKTNARAEDLVRARIAQAYIDEGLTPPGRGPRGGAGTPGYGRPPLVPGDDQVPLYDRAIMRVLPGDLKDRYINMRVRHRAQGTPVGNFVRGIPFGWGRWDNRYGGLRGSERRFEQFINQNGHVGGPGTPLNPFGRAAERYINAESSFHNAIRRANNGNYQIHVDGATQRLHGNDIERMLPNFERRYQEVRHEIADARRRGGRVPRPLTDEFTDLQQTINDANRAIATYHGSLERAERNFATVYDQSRTTMESENPAAYVQFLSRNREVVRRKDRVQAYANVRP